LKLAARSGNIVLRTRTYLNREFTRRGRWIFTEQARGYFHLHLQERLAHGLALGIDQQAGGAPPAERLLQQEIQPFQVVQFVAGHLAEHTSGEEFLHDFRGEFGHHPVIDAWTAGQDPDVAGVALVTAAGKTNPAQLHFLEGTAEFPGFASHAGLVAFHRFPHVAAHGEMDLPEFFGTVGVEGEDLRRHAVPAHQGRPVGHHLARPRPALGADRHARGPGQDQGRQGLAEIVDLGQVMVPNPEAEIDLVGAATGHRIGPD